MNSLTIIRLNSIFHPFSHQVRKTYFMNCSASINDAFNFKFWHLNEQLKYKKRHLLRCIHTFKSDLINNMDHMLNSDTEPSSVILSQRKWFKTLKSNAQKMPKQAKAKRGGVINPQNYNFNQILRREIWMLSKSCESTEVDRRTWLCVPPG